MLFVAKQGLTETITSPIPLRLVIPASRKDKHTVVSRRLSGWVMDVTCTKVRNCTEVS